MRKVTPPYDQARFLLLLIVAASLGGCEVGAPARVEAPADTVAGEIGFRMAGPNDAALLVPVHINGEGPFDFVLDTGATLTCVEQETAARLELPEQRGARGVGVGIGRAGRVNLVRVDSLRVGEARVAGMTACVLDLQQFAVLGTPIDGLLGLNFLQSFRMTLDFRRNVLLLTEP
ncbi:MAG: clan AA aspartic protease [Gemmatimonadetes bacterium]|nr:clan AA aspartic protease [Gemmatimonadota bacterium]